MPNDQSHIKKLKALTRRDPQLADIEAIEKELYGISDRATVIMLGSMVEFSLRRLLIKQIRPDLTPDDESRIFDYEGSLGSFASKILMAYALKLIGPISRSDLDLMRHMRNAFAHSRMPLKFDTPEVKSACDRLQMPDLLGSFIPQDYLRRFSDDERAQAEDITQPKCRFITACHTLAYRMIVKRDGFQAGDIAFPNDEPLP